MKVVRKDLFKTLTSILLDKFPAGRWRDHVITPRLGFPEEGPCCSRHLRRFAVPPAGGQGSGLPTPSQHATPSVLSNVVILVGVNWHLTVVVTCIPQITSDVEHLFMCLFILNEAPALATVEAQDP